MKKSALLLMLFCLACTGAKQPAIRVGFTNGNRAVYFSGWGAAIMNDMARDSVNWQNVFPVYPMPADPDDRDYIKPEQGKYRLNGETLIFTPDTPFKKGHVYFTRILRYENGHSLGDLIRHKNLLSPEKYTELTFKY